MKKLSTAAIIAGSLLLAAIPAAGSHRVSILGDSYSTFAGTIPAGYVTWYPRQQGNNVANANQCWWSLVIAGLGGKLEVNESFSGTFVCNFGGRAAYSFVNRTGNLGKPSLILICGGTNDSWGRAPLGEYRYDNWTASDLQTFRPAMAKMLADCRRLYPRAKVVFVLNSELSAGINESVLTVCRHYQVPCVVLKKIDKQQGHPSIAGMKAMAEHVLQKLNAEKIY